MWMKRDAQEALVGCKADAPMTWILRCVDGTWEGQVGICPAVPASFSGTAPALASISQHASGPAVIPKPAKIPIAYQDNGWCSAYYICCFYTYKSL